MAKGAGRVLCRGLEQSDDGGDGGDYADRAEPQMLVEGFEAFSHPQFHSLYLGAEAGHVGAEFGHVALEFGAEFSDVALEFGAEGSHIGSEFGDIGFGGDAVGKGGADGVGNGFGLRRSKASLGQGFGGVEGIKGGACHGAVFRWAGVGRGLSPLRSACSCPLAHLPPQKKEQCSRNVRGHTQKKERGDFPLSFAVPLSRRSGAEVK